MVVQGGFGTCFGDESKGISNPEIAPFRAKSFERSLYRLEAITTHTAASGTVRKASLVIHVQSLHNLTKFSARGRLVTRLVGECVVCEETRPSLTPGGSGVSL